MGDLLRLLSQAEGQDVVDVSVELLGTLANLTPLDMPAGIDWAHLASTSGEDGDLLHTLNTRLTASQDLSIDDDLLLEAVLVVQAMTLDSRAPDALADGPIPSALVHVLTVRSADPDIALHTLVALNRCLASRAVRAVLTRDAHAAAAVAALLEHSHAAIAAEADDAAAALADYDREEGTGELAEQILARRFVAHNREWAAAASRGAAPARVHPRSEAVGGGGVGGGASANATAPPGSGCAPELHPAHALRDSLAAEARADGEFSNRIYLPGGLIPLACIDDGEDVEDDGGAGDVDDSLEEAMLRGPRFGESSQGGSSTSRSPHAGMGSPSHLMGRSEAVAFDVSYLWDQANEVGEAFAGGDNAARQGAGAGTAGVRIRTGGESVTRKSINGQPFDYDEGVEVMGDHEKSEDEGDSDDVDMATEAMRAMDPYGR